MLPSELLQRARNLIADGGADSLLQGLEEVTTEYIGRRTDAILRLRDEAWTFIVASGPPTFESPDEALMFMEKAIVLAREEE